MANDRLAYLETVRRRHFPMQLPAETVARPVDAETLEVVRTQLNPILFPDDHTLRRFQIPPERKSGLRPLRDMYAEWHRERIVIYNVDGEPVGYYYGQMEDYLTFYSHTMGLIPAYRGEGIYVEFNKRLVRFLGDLGYERVTSHHQPNNRAVLISKLKAGFVISGMEIDESFGLLVKMMAFTHPDREAGFEDVFSLRPAPDA